MKKYVICDFDSTIVSIETLDELAKFVMHKSEYKADLTQKIEEITEMGMQGKISFSQSLYMRLDLMHLHKDDIEEFKDRVKNAITVSVDKNKKFIEKNRDNMYVVSGGFRELITPAAVSIGFKKENIFANDFVYDGKGYVTGFDENNFLATTLGKANQVKQLQLEGCVIMVGDGWTDYEVKQEGVADCFVAFAEHVERKIVVQHADCVAYDFDEVINFYKKV
ncbi:MAG: hypothetical protein CR972_02500 [Candidatus Moraniibacteriota bacterium]|nr:MAG: hypothetical protein CR972_02500 [Candidatus Moranbacteria bacterium]